MAQTQTYPDITTDRPASVTVGVETVTQPQTQPLVAPPPQHPPPPPPSRPTQAQPRTARDRSPEITELPEEETQRAARPLPQRQPRPLQQRAAPRKAPRTPQRFIHPLRDQWNIPHLHERRCSGTSLGRMQTRPTLTSSPKKLLLGL